MRMSEEPDQRGTVSLKQVACEIGFSPLEKKNVMKNNIRACDLRIRWELMHAMNVRKEGDFIAQKICHVSRN